MPAGSPHPEGLLLREEFVTAGEEREAVSFLERLEFDTITMRGQAARRTVVHYGFQYDYSGRRLAESAPLPGQLEFIRERLAPLMGCAREDLAQVLVQRYPAGAGIGWHLDSDIFGPRIGGVSLLGGARMRFQRTVAGTRQTAAVDLPPRSAYVLAGEARTSWQHSVPATKELRYSLTFRMLRDAAGSGPPPAR
jgi:alkylated DNA repair dioxygenase AlkB